MPEGRPPITVLVADDHPLFRDGVVRALDAHAALSVVAVAGDGEEALAAIRDGAPDVALLDVRLPKLGGIDVATTATHEGHRTRMIMLSAFAEGELVYAAVAAGAAGYLCKDATPDELCSAIEAVARGESVLPPQAQDGLMEAVRRQAETARVELTPREQEVLSLTAAGRSVGEVAAALYLGQTTVKTHLQHVYEKLGVANRAAAVAEAMRRGLIP